MSVIGGRWGEVGVEIVTSMHARTHTCTHMPLEWDWASVLDSEWGHTRISNAKVGWNPLRRSPHLGSKDLDPIPKFTTM